MASVTSRPSPNASSPYDFDSTGETDESWQYIDYSGGNSAPSSIGFLSSPASGSLSGFAVVGHVGANRTPPPSAPSPLFLGEMDQAGYYPGTSFQPQADNGNSELFGTTTTTDGGFAQGGEAFMTPQQYLFPQHELGEFSTEQLNDLGSLITTFGTEVFPINQDQQPQIDLNIPQPMQSDPNVPPWNPTTPRGGEGSVFIMDDFCASPKSMHSQSSVSSGPKSGMGSRSPSQIRKVKVGKVEKKKTDHAGKFVIVTPGSISAHAGKPNPYECFEAGHRTSQRGRKGPLANAIKENALQVRRRGACFCCHSRKVKCDLERPCKACKKLMVHVPQVVCWRFADFVPILFPDFIRGHFRKEEMSKFISENIKGFTVEGVEQPCTVELFSGPLFRTVLRIDAKFFTPDTPDVLQHWHLDVRKNGVDLQPNGSAAIGIELDNAAARDNLRKRAKHYIQDLLDEPGFVDQVTGNFYSTGLPRVILRVVKRYADQTQSLMVKRALSIYCMHYIMTRHLCLTQNTIDALGHTGHVPQNNNRVTPRVLSRQIKSVIDELMQKETQSLFDLFGKSLKPKSRREWAPCTAAFLLLCLFMEAVETAADVFVVSSNEINFRNSSRPEYERSLALNTSREVENMPFKQFAYSFHQVYQTHSKDASAKSFNPLFDRSFAEQGELDPPAIEMANELRQLLYGESWHELQFLAGDDILPSIEQHPYPRDAQRIYTGRLVARFLMSFDNDKAIFGGVA